MDTRKNIPVHRPWTIEEEDYLKENWTIRYKKNIAKILGRSERSVRDKAYALNLGDPIEAAGEYMKLYKILKEFKINSVTWYYKYLEENGLKIYKIGGKHCKRNYVKMYDFWQWVKKHENYFNFSKLEKYALGIEPPWVEKIRKQHFIENKTNKIRRWTKEEEVLLKNMLLNDFTYIQISIKLQRSYWSISCKICNLKIKYRPEIIIKKWAPEEEEKMMQLILQQQSFFQIAIALNRTEESCGWKYRHLMKVGKYAKKI